VEFSPLQAAATALLNLGLAWTVGVLTSRFWLKKGAGRWHDTALGRLSSSLTAALVTCASGTALSLWAAAANMADVGWLDAGPAFVDMLAATHYGHAGMLALGILVLAMFIHWRLPRSTGGASGAGIIPVLVVLFAVVRVSTGHAVEQGAMSIPAVVELLHLLFMALWAGIVFVGGWVVLPSAADDMSRANTAMACYLKSLSSWATAALAVILATGVYNAFRVLGSTRDLTESAYGHELVFKLCFVLVAIGLGAVNRFHGLPAVLSLTTTQDNARRALHKVIRILRIESIALLLVMAAAAVLTSSAPPGG
jgi:putative copper resistance protein D